MSASPSQSIINRSLELARGADSDYRAIDRDYFATMDLCSPDKALHAIRDIETTAWARAEYCLVRDVSALLTGERDALGKWTQIAVSQDPSQLHTKHQLLAFIARLVHGAFEPTELHPTRQLKN